MPELGELIDQKYELCRLIGQGGMGVVYEGRSKELGRRIAIKLLSAETMQSPQAVDRFKREAMLAATINNEHIVTIHDLATLPDGTPYIVMELLAGTDLAQLLKDRKRLPIAEAVDYLMQACVGLSAVHANNVVHRDLKPANLFRAQQGGHSLIKVLDFGLAKPALPDGAPELTQASTMMGSPYYMAPEQVRAQPVDARTDIWALGVILYELTTGVLPFSGHTLADVHVAILSRAPVPPEKVCEDIPRDFSKVLMRCLEKEPLRRFDNVLVLAAYLARFGSAGLRPLVHRIASTLSLTEPLIPESLDVVPEIPVAELLRQKSAEQSDNRLDPLLGSAIGNEAELLEYFGSDREVLFLVGGGIHSAPPGGSGVLDSKTIVDLLRVAYGNSEGDTKQFNEIVRDAPNQYRGALTAFTKPEAVTRVIRRAVAQACTPEERMSVLRAVEMDNRTRLGEIDRDPRGWTFTPADECLGKILTQRPVGFAPLVLTTNFDPLLECSILAHGGDPISVLVSPDGQFEGDSETGLRVIRLNGDWFNSGSPHLMVMRQQSRPHLSYLLVDALRKRSLVVLGYSGRDLELVDALVEAMRSPQSRDVIWCFLESTRQEVQARYGPVLRALRPIEKGRLKLFLGVDANRLLPKLAAKVLTPAGPGNTVLIEREDAASTGPPVTVPASGLVPTQDQLPPVAAAIVAGCLFVIAAAILRFGGSGAGGIALLAAFCGVAALVFGALKAEAVYEHHDKKNQKRLILNGPVVLVALLSGAIGYGPSIAEQLDVGPQTPPSSSAPISIPDKPTEPMPSATTATTSTESGTTGAPPEPDPPRGGKVESDVQDRGSRKPQRVKTAIKLVSGLQHGNGCFGLPSNTSVRVSVDDAVLIRGIDRNCRATFEADRGKQFSAELTSGCCTGSLGSGVVGTDAQLSVSRVCTAHKLATGRDHPCMKDNPCAADCGARRSQ